MLRKAVIIFLMFASYTAHSQAGKEEILTNQKILQLHNAELGKSVIIGKINTSKCEFALDTDDLIKLKKAGLPSDIIEAMITRSSVLSGTVVSSDNNSGKQLSVTGSDSIKAIPSGIYYMTKGSRELVELEPSVFSQAKIESGMLGMGFGKTKQRASLSGEKANLQVIDSLPEFYFYFDKAQNGNLAGSQNVGWYSSASSPNEFLLINFTFSQNKNSKNREVVTSTMSAYEGARMGIEEAYKVKFRYTKLAPGIYKVYFEHALPKGEFGFMYAGGASTYNMTQINKVFDFGVVR